MHAMLPDKVGVEALVVGDTVGALVGSSVRNRELNVANARLLSKDSDKLLLPPPWLTTLVRLPFVS